MIVLSLEEVCLDVNTSRFELPNVIEKQTRVSYRTLFTLLFETSNRKGYFELNAKELAAQCGFSRKTIYEALAFLKRVNLVKLIEERTGRGHHSLYKLNWRKFTTKAKSSAGDSTTGGKPTNGDFIAGRNVEKSVGKPVENSVSENADSPKCHPAHPYKVFKEELHPSGDININSREELRSKNSTSQEILTPINSHLWHNSMRVFRELLQSSQIPKRTQRLCIGVIGRAIKGKRRDVGFVLYHALAKHVKGLATPDWAKTAPQICRWFWSVLNKLLAGSFSSEQAKEARYSKTHPKRKIEDWNEWQWNEVSKEKDRVLKRRRHYERTWEDELAHWLEEQSSEAEFVQRRADLARMKLREQRHERNVDHTQAYMS